MKLNSLRLAVAACMFIGFGLLATNAAERNAKSAAESQARIKETVGYLSSDELGGRGPGTEGLDKAADYLAGEFKKLGLKTDLFDGSPFQKFEFNIASELGPKEQNKLAFESPERAGAKQTITLQLGSGFNPLAAGGTGKFDAELVFAGYGITAKNLDYDDYKDLNVEGKIVIVIRKEPQQKDRSSKFDGDRPSRHAGFMQKLSNAYGHGAAGVIFVNDGLELQTAREQNEKIKKEANERLAADKKKFEEIKDPTPQQRESYAESVKMLEDRIAEVDNEIAAGDKILSFNGAGDETQQRKMPVMFAKREVIDDVLQSALGKSLAEIEASIDADLKPQSAALEGWKAVGESNVKQVKAQVKNVIAVLEGEGPHADETIVIGAHYDHLGMGGLGSLAPWTKEIHNGADDNASGTSTLVEVAHLLATSGKKPRHRIVFMCFSGEERGLLGSAHYTREPRFPLDKTIAMYNLDMVGRLRDNTLLVDGVGTAKEFEPLVDSLAAKYDFKLKKKPGGYGPSDHASFYAKKIPVLHVWTDLHDDYHRPSDDWPKLNLDGMQRIAEFVVDIVNATDEKDTRPEYVEMKRAEVAAGDRPYLGSVPDFGSNAEGAAISAVSPGSPAEKAGMKGGDVIVKLGESKIGGLEDLQSALLKHKVGETIKIVVKRDGKEVTLEATLAKRGPMP